MPPLRIVFDTNVLLSLWVFDKSPGGSTLAPLRAMIESGALLALSRADCLAEFERVLGYPEFKLVPEMQQRIFSEYRSVLTMPADAGVNVDVVAVATDVPLPKCSDRDDQKFLELARDATAQILVTRDKALLKLARRRQLAGLFRILTPDRLLEELLSEPAGELSSALP